MVDIPSFRSRRTVLTGGIVAALIIAGLFLIFALNAPGTEQLHDTGSRFANSEPPTEHVAAVTTLGDIGTFATWSLVETTFTGPDSTGMSDANNPFKIVVDVTFSGPNGETFTVPAFYDGDGGGGLDGNVWKVRFSPNAVGSWSFESFSSEPQLDNQTGTFDVTAPTNCESYMAGGLPDFSCVGRLEHIGDHYLKFADGPYWLKGGEDDPEDFLAPGQNAGFGSKEAAIDYLAGAGVNSLYIMLHNVGGDASNVWPWVGSSESEAQSNDEHFDVAKLAQWESLFTYLQNKGIVLHLVFEDDSGWTGFNRSLYYREMIARFGHHNGLYWNISEEYNENYSSNEVKNFAQAIRDIDPYDHPITVHNQGGLGNWDPFVGDDRFDLTSFQTSRSPQNQQASSWFYDVENAGATIPISFDETGKIGAGERDMSRHIVWSVFLGGANFEMHTSPLSDYQDFAAHFADMTRARSFLESLPFWEMEPLTSLITDGQGYLFAKPGSVYVAYLPNGGSIDIDLSSNSNAYDALWYNPRDDSTQQIGPIAGGDERSFSAPDSNDWVLLLQQTSGNGNVTPLAQDGSATTPQDTPASITLSYSDPDGPGPYTYTIVDPPDHGELSGAGQQRTYTPDAGYTGSDSFTWQVNDGLADSNVATFSLSVNEPGANQPPIAEDATVAVFEEQATNLQLVYTDPDNGPGPYEVTIVDPPEHGTLTGDNNDQTYTPDAGYTGTDEFTWQVNDGAVTSNVATVQITVTAGCDSGDPPHGSNGNDDVGCVFIPVLVERTSR